MTHHLSIGTFYAADRFICALASQRPDPVGALLSHSRARVLGLPVPRNGPGRFGKPLGVDRQCLNVEAAKYFGEFGAGDPAA